MREREREREEVPGKSFSLPSVKFVYREVATASGTIFYMLKFSIHFPHRHPTLFPPIGPPQVTRGKVLYVMAAGFGFGFGSFWLLFCIWQVASAE